MRSARMLIDWRGVGYLVVSGITRISAHLVTWISSSLWRNFSVWKIVNDIVSIGYHFILVFKI